MRMFILAAGTGSRLFPLTKNTPKSLLDLGDGVSLLDNPAEPEKLLIPRILAWLSLLVGSSRDSGRK